MRLSDRTPSRAKGAALLRLYPRAWRDRYESEMLAVIEARRLDWRTRLDLLRGALDAHLHPAQAPAIPVLAALVAGVTWIVAGVASITQPLPPDWPGFLLETLPLGLLGAIAELRVVLAIGRRSGLGGPRGTGVALVFAAVGHVVWIVVLAVAAIGGPYGAITGAGQSLAAVGTLAVGLVRARAADHTSSLALVVAGAAMLVPSPLTWPLAGGAWLALAVAGGRPPVPLRRA
jgi:hypothetical protein